MPAARTACASSCCATSTSPAPIRKGRTGQATPQATHLIKVACEAALGKRAKIDVFGTDYPNAGRHLRARLHPRQRPRRARIRPRSRYLRRGGASATFNCGYGRGASVLEVIDAVQARQRRDFPVERIGRRRAAIRPRWSPTSTRIRSDARLAAAVPGPRHHRRATRSPGSAALPAKRAAARRLNVLAAEPHFPAVGRFALEKSARDGQGNERIAQPQWGPP